MLCRREINPEKFVKTEFKAHVQSNYELAREEVERRYPTFRLSTKRNRDVADLLSTCLVIADIILR